MSHPRETLSQTDGENWACGTGGQEWGLSAGVKKFVASPGIPARSSRFTSVSELSWSWKAFPGAVVGEGFYLPPAQIKSSTQDHFSAVLQPHKWFSQFWMGKENKENHASWIIFSTEMIWELKSMFLNKVFIGTWSCLFVYLVPMMAYTLKGHCHSDQMATNPKIAAIWSVLYREVCGSYSRAG